jgi:hypothetical protein
MTSSIVLSKETAMAKGHMRPGKEKWKPKADKNKKQKGAPPASPFAKEPMRPVNPAPKKI